MNDTDDDDDQIRSNNYTIAKLKWNELSERPSGEIESMRRTVVVSPRGELWVRPQLANYVLMAEAANSNLWWLSP